MRRTEDIVFGNLGQTLALRVLSGRPASATFDVLKDVYGDDAADYEEEFSGVGVVDTVDTTVDAASGPSQADPHVLNLTSTVGVQLLRKYALTKNGKIEWVEPVEIEAGAIRCRHALTRDYAATAPFQSTYITFAIDATWVADENSLSDVLDPNPDYRLRAAVVSASAAVETHYIFFDLVRASINHSIILQDLTARWPALAQKLPHDQEQDRLAPMIDATWRSLRAELHVLGLNDAAIRDHEAVDEAMILRLRVALAEAGYIAPNWEPVAYWDMAQERFSTFWENNFKLTLKRDIASGTSGGAPERVPAQPIWSK